MGGGKLLDLITIERPGSEIAPKGGRVKDDWVVVHKKIPARVRELTGKSLENAHQYWADATIDVMVRWHENVDETCRIIWHSAFGDRVLGLGHIRNKDNRRNWQIILAEEKKQ